MNLSEFILECPSCGEEDPLLHEGYCEDCWADRQGAPDFHNSQYDYWNSLTDKEKEDIDSFLAFAGSSRGSESIVLAAAAGRAIKASNENLITKDSLADKFKALIKKAFKDE